MPDAPALPPRSTVVLSIDLQNEYRAACIYPVEDYDRILANASAVIAAARAGGVPVIHVQAWVGEEDRQHYPLLEASLTDDLRSAVAGSDGAGICEEVAPLEGETVIRKRWPSAFHDTDLDERLRRLGAENIVTVGVWTDSCVRASVFDAVFRSYRVWLVKEACGSRTDAMHRTAMLDMANRLYGGGVLRTGEALKALRGQPHAAWRCSRPIEFPYTLATIDGLYDVL
ncbi:cysteine hydrolase family protein [Labrys wisconsinensis]|uniref:Nicotinamidase-related amidase n=1 Tax=Labrys wisconsinensis TaxID=425677 RepID=A0ABU0JJA7_9HYPH|nr:isochorismatase family cysteine hydrolase [Labrys wisconsinensis]MDQ0474363.1 nicotinamidase-related amidase [Labrys wisconsinensis]